jgi:hypothetical protein
VYVKTLVGRFDQLTVKPFLAAAGLVARYEKNGLAVRIESEGHPPDTISGVKSQFLHVPSDVSR